MATIKKRRVEIIAFTMERAPNRSGLPFCSICQRESAWLTTAQAAALAQVGLASIRRWLALGKAHGLRTVGGQHRICRQSLFINSQPEIHVQEVGNEILYEDAK